MKNIKKIFLVMLTVILGLVIAACEENHVVPEAPVITPAVAVFDKDDPANVVVALDLKGEQLISIKLNNADLSTSAYTHQSGNLTILATYLQTLANGSYAFVVATAGGTATLTVTVTDAESPVLAPVITPTTAVFDKDEPANIVAGLDLKGQQMISIKVNNADLSTAAYTHQGGNLTVLATYLQTLTNGSYAFVVTTAGGTATLTITVTDAESPVLGFERPNYDVDFYSNMDFHNYGEYETTIEGQWPGYGIGDPFVMRYNGVYYLYVSTLDSEMVLELGNQRTYLIGNKLRVKDYH